MQHDENKYRTTAQTALTPEPLASQEESLEDEPYNDDEENASHMSAGTKRGTGVWVLIGMVILAVGLGAAYLKVNHSRTSAEATLAEQTMSAANVPLPVNVVPVEYAPASHVITLPGETRAWYETMIYARVNGYVKKWLVDIGDKVHGGQVLATIETPELDQQLTAALGKVEAAKAQIKLAQANAHFSEVTYARYKDAPKGMVSDLERDQKQADYQTSVARVTTAQSDLDSAQANVDQLRAMIAFKEVIAPFDGVITERRVDIGDLVTAGSTTNTTSLFKIVQPDPMRVLVEVPEQAAAQIHDGDGATVTAQEYPDRKFEGHVARNARAINSTAKTLRVEVDVPNHDFVLLPGMYVEVNFQINDRKPALQVPASAMNFRSGGPQVAVVSKDGRVTFKNVTILKDMGDVVQIGTGLAPHEEVAMNISNQIMDGDRVKPIQAEETDNPAPHPTGTLTSTTAKVLSSEVRPADQVKE